MSIESILNYSYINNRLATSGQPEQHELQFIRDAGYQTVINLALHDAEYSLLDEASSVTALGMQYCHLPVQWQQPSNEDLEQFFALMKQSPTQRLFVHCAANRRVSVFLALFFMTQKIWSREQAMDHIHSIWTPDDVWLMFLNQQMHRLGL